MIISGWATFGAWAQTSPIRWDREVLKNVLNNLNDAWAQTSPMRLEKESMITVWARSL